MTLPQAMAEAARLEAAGQMSDAEAMYRKMLAASPDFHPAYHALGLLAYQYGKLALAAELTAKAIALNSTVGMYQRNFGEMCRRLGRLDEAIAAGKRAVQLTPEDADAHYNLGLALAEQKEYNAAISYYRCALALKPDYGLVWNNLGSALELMGDKPAAEKAYVKAVAINPKHSEAQNNLGAIYSEQGKLDQACACFNAAIAARPSFAEAHFNLSTLKTYTTSDPHFIMLETLSEVAESLPIEMRMRLNFALGKAREDVGDYDRSFAAYAQGNRLHFSLHPVDETQADIYRGKIISTFTEQFFKQHAPSTTPSNKVPVFIVGMPRSGTTLIEQILSSHPAVFGAGELMDLNEVITQAPQSASGHHFTEWCLNVSPDELAMLGRQYEQRVWKLAPDKAIITDKMPGNFSLIGMIHQMLPHAKIIHAMRDPMDSCFSCYSRLFNDSMDFAYDLGTLGRYYVRYRQMMQHWHAVLPAGTILDVHYEEVVADMPQQTRRMLDYIGLPWDEACLSFHRNQRLVKTASVAQVRKPIYTTSVARWEKFRAHLSPLLEIVQNYRHSPLYK